MENMTTMGMTILTYGFTIVISLLIALLIKIMAALLTKFSKPVPEGEQHDSYQDIVAEEREASSKDVEIAIAVALAKSKK